jgi:hypothetical protein
MNTTFLSLFTERQKAPSRKVFLPSVCRIWLILACLIALSTQAIAQLNNFRSSSSLCTDFALLLLPVDTVKA